MTKKLGETYGGKMAVRFEGSPKSEMIGHRKRNGRHKVRGSHTIVKSVEHFGAGKQRIAEVGRAYGTDPAHAIARQITEALRPELAPSAVQTLATITPEKRAEMDRLYGKGPKK